VTRRRTNEPPARVEVPPDQAVLCTWCGGAMFSDEPHDHSDELEDVDDDDEEED
jgi:hypothetical protein